MENKYTIRVFIDLLKAIDTADHNISTKNRDVWC